MEARRSPRGSASGLAPLSDNRAWELVSPAINKDGVLILPIEEAGGLVQAAEDGSAITYLSVGPAKSGQKRTSFELE